MEKKNDDVVVEEDAETKEQKRERLEGEPEFSTSPPGGLSFSIEKEHLGPSFFFFFFFLF